MVTQTIQKVDLADVVYVIRARFCGTLPATAQKSNSRHGCRETCRQDVGATHSAGILAGRLQGSHPSLSTSFQKTTAAKTPRYPTATPASYGCLRFHENRSECHSSSALRQTGCCSQSKVHLLNFSRRASRDSRLNPHDLPR